MCARCGLLKQNSLDLVDKKKPSFSPHLTGRDILVRAPPSDNLVHARALHIFSFVWPFGQGDRPGPTSHVWGRRVCCSASRSARAVLFPTFQSQILLATWPNFATCRVPPHRSSVHSQHRRCIPKLFICSDFFVMINQIVYYTTY